MAADTLTAPYERALAEAAPQLLEEIDGIAEGADLPRSAIVRLNLGPADPAGSPGAAGRPPPGQHTAIYFAGQRGATLGQAVVGPAGAGEELRLLVLTGADRHEPTVVLTQAGALGMGGLNAAGLAVLSCSLSCTDDAPGLGRSAVVRRLLQHPSVESAYAELLELPRATAGFYMLADGHDYNGVEATAGLAVRTQKGPKAAHLHTNHCFDPVLRKREAVPVGSTSFARLNLASTLYAQQRPTTADAMTSLLDATLQDVPAGPDARTATVVIEPEPGRIAVAGGVAGRHGAATELRPGRDG